MSSMNDILAKLAILVEETGYGFLELPIQFANRYKQGYEKLRTEIAVASLSILEEDDPLFGKGSLLHHDARVVEDPTNHQAGLEVIKRESPQPNPSILILEAAISGDIIQTNRFSYSGVLKARNRLAGRMDLPEPVQDAVELTLVTKQDDGFIKIFRHNGPSPLTSAPVGAIIEP